MAAAADNNCVVVNADNIASLGVSDGGSWAFYLSPRYKAEVVTTHNTFQDGHFIGVEIGGLWAWAVGANNALRLKGLAIAVTLVHVKLETPGAPDWTSVLTKASATSMESVTDSYAKAPQTKKRKLAEAEEKQEEQEKQEKHVAVKKDSTEKRSGFGRKSDAMWISGGGTGTGERVLSQEELKAIRKKEDSFGLCAHEKCQKQSHIGSDRCFRHSIQCDFRKSTGQYCPRVAARGFSSCAKHLPREVAIKIEQPKCSRCGKAEAVIGESCCGRCIGGAAEIRQTINVAFDQELNKPEYGVGEKIYKSMKAKVEKANEADYRRRDAPELWKSLSKMWDKQRELGSLPFWMRETVCFQQTVGPAIPEHTMVFVKPSPRSRSPRLTFQQCLNHQIAGAVVDLDED